MGQHIAREGSDKPGNGSSQNYRRFPKGGELYTYSKTHFFRQVGLYLALYVKGGWGKKSFKIPYKISFNLFISGSISFLDYLDLVSKSIERLQHN